MIRDDLFPDGMSEESIDNLHKRARLAGIATTGTGTIIYLGNEGRKQLGKSVGKKIRGHKFVKKAGLSLAGLGLASTGLSEYLHYKYKKKLKESKNEDNSEKED